MSKPKTAVEILEAAMALVKRGWCQGPAAMNAAGLAVSPGSRTAVRWCGYGAIRAVCRPTTDIEVRYRVLNFLRRAAGTPIALFNEHPGRKKSEVLAAYRRAIKLAKAAA